MRRLAIILMAISVSLPAQALPRFAARMGVTCETCHVNPTGGGLRNTFGSDAYARMILPLKPGMGPEIKTNWSPNENLWVGVGGDFRAGFVGIDSQVQFDPTTDAPFQIPEVVSLFVMQADVYIATKLSKYITLYADYGLISNNSEIFGLVKPGFAKSYLKIGAFMPPYGLKLANHRTTIREDGLGLHSNLREAAVEMGTNPGPFNLAAAVFNGGGGAGGLNPDYRIGLSGRADFTMTPGQLKLTLGSSWWWQPGGDVIGPSDERTLDLRAGGYWTASMGPLTYLGEADYRLIRDMAMESEVEIVAMYNELAYLPVQGVDISLSYEYLDPDASLKPNAMHRLGFGIEFFPIPHTEIKLLARHTLADKASLEDPRTFYTTGVLHNLTEVTLFLHLFL